MRSTNVMVALYLRRLQIRAGLKLIPFAGAVNLVPLPKCSPEGENGTFSKSSNSDTRRKIESVRGSFVLDVMTENNKPLT